MPRLTQVKITLNKDIEGIALLNEQDYGRVELTFDSGSVLAFDVTDRAEDKLNVHNFRAELKAGGAKESELATGGILLQIPEEKSPAGRFVRGFR